MLFCFLFPLLNFFSPLQEVEGGPSFHLNKFISCEASFILTDNIGNIYAIAEYEIKKYNSKGDLEFTFSDKSRGEIAFVDVSNPLNILVFYRDFHQLIFLDNMLSPIGDSYNLIENNLDQVSLSCSSRDNGIWLFDQQKFQLMKMDKNFQIIQQSAYINQILSKDIHFNYMLEYNNQLYVNDPETGIMIFDIYGAYYKTIPIKQLKSFQLAGDKIYYLLDGSLRSYHTKTLEEQSMQLPEPNASCLRIEGNTIVLLANGHLSIYTILY
jgi:hypothetical protein